MISKIESRKLLCVSEEATVIVPAYFEDIIVMRDQKASDKEFSDIGKYFIKHVDTKTQCTWVISTNSKRIANSQLTMIKNLSINLERIAELWFVCGSNSKYNKIKYCKLFLRISKSNEWSNTGSYKMLWEQSSTQLRQNIMFFWRWRSGRSKI